MKASLRWYRLMAGGLLLLPAATHAQSASGSDGTNPPSATAVGPQELQNFSLPGAVSKPADEPPANAAKGSVAQVPAPSDVTTTASPPVDRRPADPPVVRSAVRRERAPVSIGAAKPPSTLQNSSLGALQQSPPAVPSAPLKISPPAAAPAFPAAPSVAESTGAHGILLWPWLLAAIAIAVAAFLLLYRRRHQRALAGGPDIHVFAAPEPVRTAPRPAPAPAPAPRAAAPAPRAVAPARPEGAPATPLGRPSGGIVSTRLRPALEILVQPLRCIVNDEQVVLEFELELFNSGTAPARAILAEASLFNAGPAQEQELGAFFAKPVGAGERLDAIPPMRRVAFVNKVTAPRSAVQEYELGGRKVFVPLLAFNALYSWSGGEAQTSAAYLVGRETGGDKLGPLTLDGKPREIGRLACRLLPSEVRT